MSEYKEYIVTLKDFNDLESFYQDMETPGGDLYIPHRQVEVADRRPISRNTHYFLSDEEATQLSADPRVLSVNLTCRDLGIEARPLYFQSSLKWDKGFDDDRNDHRNWGLYRCTLANQVSGWGYDGFTSASGSIDIRQTGKNVDVIICDGHIDPTHPEFAVNANGTGGSRVVQYNWFGLNAQYRGVPNGTYVYTPYVDPTYTDADKDGISDRTDDNNHGCHVAGIACGNTQGWARDANIYNISPYSTNPNSLSIDLLIDYIRYFHQNKPVNPVTGRKNPTIVNNSWGIFISRSLRVITSLTYRGETTLAPISAYYATSAGLRIVQNSSGSIGGGPLDYDAIFFTSVQYPSLDADIADAIDDGIIFVGAAGNEPFKTVRAGHVDYNNFIQTTVQGLSTIFFNRPCSPLATDDAISVGAVSAEKIERKSNFSCTGPRVDIYAPGENIMSSLNALPLGQPGTYDQRNDQYFISKLNGTSMASPQVCGVLACALEIFPTWSQKGAKEYIISLAKTDKLTNVVTTFPDLYSLQGGNNQYLFYKNEKNIDSQIYPYNWYAANKGATQSGQIYPRPRIFSYGTQTPL